MYLEQLKNRHERLQKEAIKVIEKPSHRDEIRLKQLEIVNECFHAKQMYDQYKQRLMLNILRVLEIRD